MKLSKLVVMFSCALVLSYGISGAFAGGVYVEDRDNPQVLIPSNYYTFTPPSAGGDYVDAVFNTTVRRLTAETRLVHVGQSEYTNFNADDSLFFSSIAGGVYLYDASTGELVKQIGFNIANVRWSPTEKDYFFYMTGSQIRKYNVQTMNYELIHDFGSSIDDCGGDGNQISDNGQFWLINQGSEMFVYDLVNGIEYPRGDLGQLGFGCKQEGCIDFASISPTGDYILANWYPVSSLSGHHGIEAYDKDWNFVSRNYPFNSHHSVGIIDGEEWIIAPAQFNSTPGAQEFNQQWDTTPGDLIAAKISEPEVRVLMPMSVWTYFETGAYKGTRDEYVYIAAEERGYDPTDGCQYCCQTCLYNEQSSERCGWYPYFGEIIEVPLDLSKPIRRLVHHRAFAPACLTHEYKNQPDFFVSHGGDKIVFQSNHGLEQPDAYMMWVTPRSGGDGDSDDDGLPDAWEMQYFDDLSQGPDGDYDGDGVSNYDEYQHNADPTNPDTDSDGIPDDWEIQYGLNPSDASDADDDTDGDGLTNLEEYLAGSNPTVFNAPPQAVAGPDQTVVEATTVTLDGSNSTDQDDDIATYLWTQTAGIQVTLSAPSATNTTFVAPPVGAEGAVLAFQLTVTDYSGLQSADEISVTVSDNGITGFPETMLTVTCVTGETIGVEVESGGNCTSLDASDPSTISDATNRPDDLVYGLIDMDIKVDSPGATVLVSFYLPAPAQEDERWFKYGPNDGWASYAEHSVFSAARDKVTLTLVDGGSGDEDGVANGVIKDPSGLGKPADSTADPAAPAIPTGVESPRGGCFMATMASW